MLPDPYNRISKGALHWFAAKAGEPVFRMGEVSRGLYIVLTGRVHLERVGPNGEHFVIHRAGLGESFAEASLFSEHYHCDAVMIEAGDLVRIDKKAILAAFSDPVFAQAYGLQASRLIQAQRQLLEITGIRSAQDRVLAGLVAGLNDGTVVDFAARLNLTQEATFRALRSLVTAGCVQNPSRGKYRLAE